MYVALWEGNRDAFGVESFLHFFLHVPVERPQVAGLGPGAHGQVDRAFAQATHHNQRSRVFQGAFVFFDQALADRLGLVDVVAVPDAEGHIATTGFIHAHVGQAGVGQLAVRDHHATVIKGVDDGVQDADFTHRTQETLCFDGIAHLERLEDQDQYATGKVAQAALQGQAHGQAGGTDNGDEGGGGNADHGSHGNQQQDLEDGAGQAAQEFVKRGVFLAQLVVQHADKAIDQPHADNEGDDGQHHFRGVGHNQRNALVNPFRRLSVTYDVFHIEAP